jgi:hypothetical protein
MVGYLAEWETLGRSMRLESNRRGALGREAATRDIWAFSRPSLTRAFGMSVRVAHTERTSDSPSSCNVSRSTDVTAQPANEAPVAVRLLVHEDSL